jgi:hypothetical protein
VVREPPVEEVGGLALLGARSEDHVTPTLLGQSELRAGGELS